MDLMGYITYIDYPSPSQQVLQVCDEMGIETAPAEVLTDFGLLFLLRANDVVT